MRSLFSTVAAIATLAIATPSEAQVFNNHGTVSATRKGDKVTVVVAGKGEWHVNMEYDIKVTLGDKKLGKADARYAGGKDGKADSATFETSEKASSGEVKAVFCDAHSCTAPMKIGFQVK